MSQLTTLVILAGGNGSRFGGPKQFACFGHLQRTLMEYNIYHAIEAEFSHVVLITQASQKAQLEREVIARLPEKIVVSIAVQTNNIIPQQCYVPPERTKPLGTAHALWCAKDYIKGRFVVINADDYYGPQAFLQLQHWHKHLPSGSINNRYAMVAYLVENTLSEHGGVNRGLCEYDSEMCLKHIEEVESIRLVREGEKPAIQGQIVNTKETISIPPNSLVSMNCWAFDKCIFPAIERLLIDTFVTDTYKRIECYLPKVVMTQLVNEHTKVTILVSKDDWFGVTYAEDSISVDSKINQLITKDKLKLLMKNIHS